MNNRLAELALSGADLRHAAAALREAATARGDSEGGWHLAELALLFEREADLADLEEHEA